MPKAVSLIVMITRNTIMVFHFSMKQYFEGYREREVIARILFCNFTFHSFAVIFLFFVQLENSNRDRVEIKGRIAPFVQVLITVFGRTWQTNLRVRSAPRFVIENYSNIS